MVNRTRHVGEQVGVAVADAGDEAPDLDAFSLLGRCLLAGDAAHIMSPAGAQGMNTGLQDAVNLGWRLGGVLRGTLPEQALAGYDRDRRDAAHNVARTTALQTRWGLLRKGRHIAVRDAALRAASAGGLLQRRIAPLVAQTGVRYPARSTGAMRDSLPGRRRTRPGERLPVLPVVPSDAMGPATAIRVAGRTWTATAADAPTVLLWPGRRTPADWAATVERARQLATPAAAVVEERYAENPLADALGQNRAAHCLTGLAATPGEHRVPMPRAPRAPHRT